MSESQPNMAIRTASKPLSIQYDVMFDRDISGPQEWHEEFFTLRQATDKDIVNIHINTCGGSVATISAFQNIKSKSEAHFHGILEGIGYSAGSAFFLMCDTHEVGDLAEMMIHTSQGGYHSHSQGREEYGKQSARTARILVEKVYKDFLTEEEIEDILKGAELWLDSEEIKSRLVKRDEIRQKRQNEETKKLYPVNVYASQAVEDIMADCEAFDYDATEIVELMLEQLKGQVNTVNSEEDVETEPDINVLKNTADYLELSYPHNIGIETLRNKILAHLNK